jgi:hypothetical protein
VVTALAGAIDGGQRLWEVPGPWTDRRLGAAYRWRAGLRWAALGLAAAVAILLTPLVVLVAAAVLYAAATLASLVSLTTIAERLIAVYRLVLEWLFAPPVLPTIVPRAVVLAVLVVAAILVAAAIGAGRRERSRRRRRGAFWWRLVGSPLTAVEPAALLLELIWGLVRGASSDLRPAVAEVGRRYVDVLTDNFGQPGFHEVVVAVHDVDARRDLTGAVLPAAVRGGFEARRADALGPREAETVDFTGPGRRLVADFVSGALRLPLMTAAHEVVFPSESYWRGETHRLCDRPELAARLVDELAAIGVEQLVIVSPTAPAGAPHGLRPRPVDLRARAGEFVRSVETAAVEDAVAAARARFSGVFAIRPGHNPIGPFDFAGADDETSDRRWTVADLVEQGYADAYQRFIEPIVAAGERLHDL